MHRALVRMLRVCGVRFLYAVAYVFVVPPTFLFRGKGRKTVIRFYRQAFGMGYAKARLAAWRNHCAFARVVIDRFAMYAGKHFDIDLDGYERFAELASRPEAFIQLSAHIGNYELAGYSLVAKDKPIKAVVFAGEKETVMHNRMKMFSDKHIDMISMRPDMSHLFEINDAVERGEIVSMAADRIFGSQKYYQVDFFGRKARLPQGPFVLAAMRGLPVLFVSVMNVAPKKYRTYIYRITVQEGVSVGERAAALAGNYACRLEEVVRLHPEQWYNYFDFLD